ncbi:ribonuclease III [bacterium]|nr:ribonuclease III [bacterium]
MIFKFFHKLFRIKNDFSILEKLIQYRFNDINIFHQAFTHRSLNSEPKKNYERLEFLGDAVLDIIISKLLMAEFPAGDEGLLTKKRAAIVQRSFLAIVGELLGLLNYLRIDQGIDIKQNKVATRQNANLVEALIGAVYLDGGLEPCSNLVRRLIWSHRDEAWKATNYKGKLIEYCHSISLESPVFHTTNISGPDHDKVYEIYVQIGNRIFPTAIESNKKAAEQTAASNALSILNGIDS